MLAMLAVAWGRKLYQASAVQGLKGDLSPETPAASRICVLGQNRCLCSTKSAPGPQNLPGEHCARFVHAGGEFPRGVKGKKACRADNVPLRPL